MVAVIKRGYLICRHEQNPKTQGAERFHSISLTLGHRAQVSARHVYLRRGLTTAWCDTKSSRYL